MVRKMAIIIPAHDEESLIADTVRSALEQNYPKEAYGVWVVADNCQDHTADEARSAGGLVMERKGSPGKGQALNDIFQRLLSEAWEAFVIVDADSRLHPDTLSALNDCLAAGAAAITIPYGVLNPEASWRTRTMELSTASFNGIRPQGRAALGLSAGIYGNGFCLARQTLLEVPYLAESIVEDIEYHLLLLRAGKKVDFCGTVWVKARMPLGQRAARTQRVRWERGRWLMIKAFAPRLLADLVRGKPSSIDGLVDVLAPPMGWVVLAQLLALAGGNPLQRVLASLGLVILLLHYLAAAWRYGSLAALPGLALYLPWYLVEKLWMVLHSFVTERNLPWMRTDREI